MKWYFNRNISRLYVQINLFHFNYFNFKILEREREREREKYSLVITSTFTGWILVKSFPLGPQFPSVAGSGLKLILIEYSFGVTQNSTRLFTPKIKFNYTCGLQLPTYISQTSATDWQAAARRDNMISVTLLLTSLIRSATCQSSCYPIVLTRPGGPHSRTKPHLKLQKCRESKPRPSWLLVRRADP